MPKNLILSLFFTLSLSTFAQTRDFQTTRLLATAGAGVASLNMLDSAVLNPSSIAFFKNTEGSYLYRSSKFQSGQSKTSFLGHGLILADAKSYAKGSISFFDTEDIKYKQQSYGITFGKRVSKLSSFGLAYQYKRIKEKSTNQKKSKHIFKVGNTSIISKNISVGTLIIDPLHSNSFEHRFIMGAQIQLASTVYLMIDGLSNIKFKNFSETFGWRTAIQLKLIESLYARVGYSKDKKENTKELGYGLDLRLEKFNLGFGFKTSRILDENLPSILMAKTKSTELVLKASIRY